ncbi:MAG: HDIG domain-containing protein [Actinobacteria bacterium]|nr:HDIG domain-containing protein [Actinomycetota bacterium]
MKREEALELVKQMVPQPNLIKHMLATEAVMKALANHFGEDVDSWGLAGLLHDVDYAETYDNPEIHAVRSAEILKEKGVSEEIIKAILAHNNKAPKDTLMAKALYAVDPLTGFLVACALMTPEKKMAAVDVDFALRRFKEKSFARGANREQINYCGEFGLSLEEFLEIGIKAMQGISKDLGL